MNIMNTKSKLIFSIFLILIFTLITGCTNNDTLGSVNTAADVSSSSSSLSSSNEDTVDSQNDTMASNSSSIISKENALDSQNMDTLDSQNDTPTYVSAPVSSINEEQQNNSEINLPDNTVTCATGTSDITDSPASSPTFESPYQFYDVFRNEYEMNINPVIPANSYNPENYTYLVFNTDNPPVSNADSDNMPASDANSHNPLITDVEINPDANISSNHESETLGYTGIIKYEDDTYTSKFGIDVSKFQKNINWEKVASYGVEFAFIRVGYRGYGKEGSLESDPYYRQNITNAIESGIDVGVYFFAQAINEKEALEEAEYVLELISDYDINLPIVYDPEHIRNHVARTNNVTAEQFTKNAKVFCERIKEAGYTPMLYANMLWEAYEIDLSQIPDVEIWYADYELKPQTPYNFRVWQYSQAGSVPGINGRVDLNLMITKK